MRPELRVTNVLCLSLLSLSTLGCLTVRESDVPGTYCAKADWGTSTLILAADHSFHQTVRINSGPVKQADGKWKLVSPAKNSLSYNITLAPYLWVAHDKQGTYAPWDFSSITRRGIGGMEIAADPDWGIAYRK